MLKNLFSVILETIPKGFHVCQNQNVLILTNEIDITIEITILNKHNIKYEFYTHTEPSKKVYYCILKKEEYFYCISDNALINIFKIISELIKTVQEFNCNKISIQ